LSSYALTTGGIVAVKFTNDVPEGATLNINSKGAKAIYHRGAKIAAGVIKAGDTATFIYSSYYHLLSIDRDEDNTTTLSDLGVTATASELNVLDGITATVTELNYIDGVTSNIQTQLNGKAPTSHASTATTYGAASASNYGHAMASSTTPKANGTAAVGSETAKFARGDHVHPLQTTVSGNAGTATKLASAKTITLSGDISGSVSFDGSTNVTITTAITDALTQKVIAALPIYNGEEVEV